MVALGINPTFLQKHLSPRSAVLFVHQLLGLFIFYGDSYPVHCISELLTHYLIDGCLVFDYLYSSTMLIRRRFIDMSDWITNYDELQEYVANCAGETAPKNPKIVANDAGIIGVVLRREGSDTEWIYSDYAVELE